MAKNFKHSQDDKSECCGGNDDNNCDIVNESVIGYEEEGCEDSEPLKQESEPRYRSLKIAGRRGVVSLWILMWPPVFLDWEEILRNHTDRTDVFDKTWLMPLPKELGPTFKTLQI